MQSLSSSIISNITAFRNPNGTEQVWARNLSRFPANPLKVALAEVGYIVAIPFAIIETAISAIAKLFTVCLPMNQTSHDAMTDWLSSSAFSIIWSGGDAAINLVCNDMIVSERVARACASRGNIFVVPREAL